MSRGLPAANQTHTSKPALYSLANARGYAVVCFAHVTNQMGQSGLDFEKGEASGATDALQVIEAAIAALEHENPVSA